MQDYNLKPCPFCGGRKIELVEPDYFFGSWFCECTACRQAIAAGETLEKAMKKWNRRAPEECRSESPTGRTEEEAYKAAMKRRQEPNRVLTLDELKTYIGYAWYEGDHKWYHSSFDYPVWIEDGKYNYEGDLYDIPDVEGHFWLRKPTKAELDAKGRTKEDE